MNSKQARTLGRLFSDPLPAGLAWADIESLFMAVGCQRIEWSGSRVRFVCKGVVASFHRPHPAKEAKQYQVRDARAFLTSIGVKP